MNSLYINPFTLNHCMKAYQLKSPLGMVKGAAYDLIIQNPYNLTFANYQIDTPSRVIKYTIIILSALYTSMLYGATIYVTAQSILALSPQNSLIKNLAIKVKKLGESLFMIGAIPIYGIFYAFPKYAIKELPKIVHNHLIKISNYIYENVFYPLWKTIILPTLTTIEKGLNLTFYWIQKGFNFAIQWIQEKSNLLITNINNLAITIFNHTLKPLWKKIILPILTIISKGINSLFKGLNYAIQWIQKTSNLLITSINNLAITIFNHTLKPLWKKIILPILTIISKGINSLFKGLNYAIQWIQKTSNLLNTAYGLANPVSGACRNLAPFPNSSGIQTGGDANYGATYMPMRYYNPNATLPNPKTNMNTAYGLANPVSGACRNLAPFPNSSGIQTGGIKKKKKSVRKCPNKPAKEFNIGTKKKGNDGKMWIVSKRKDKVKVWKRA